MDSLSQMGAVDVTAHCFLNALLWERGDWKSVPDAPPQQKKHICLPLIALCAQPSWHQTRTDCRWTATKIFSSTLIAPLTGTGQKVTAFIGKNNK